MTPALKNQKIRFFKTEESFCRYLEYVARSRGYVLVETSPLVKSRDDLGSASNHTRIHSERARG